MVKNAILKSFCLWVVIGALPGYSAWAGLTGKIAGRVVDEQDGRGLPGARVSVLGTSRGTLTDEDGNYYIINLAPGVYTLQASMIGYQSVTLVDLRCHADLTTRANFRLRPTPLAAEGVTIVAQRPIVDKDLTSTMRTISPAILEDMPWDNLQQAVAAQTGVVRLGEELHLRGGRSDEVDYLIDGISVRDATEGYTGLLINANALSDLSLLTGVYNAEYSEAMSGVINASVKEGREAKLNVQYNSGRLFPEGSGRGFQSVQVDWGRPLLKDRATVFGAVDVSQSGDWDPHRVILPHQDRQDYSWLGKSSFRLTTASQITLLAAGSRSQFGRYSHVWYFLPHSYRSDLRRGSLVYLKLNQTLTGSSCLQITLGRFANIGKFGVRDTFWENGRYWWEDIRFFDYWDNQIYYNQDSQLVFTAGYNPYGYDRTLFYRYGCYWQFRDRRTEERFLKTEWLWQASHRHQIRAGAQFSWYRIDNFHIYATAVGRPIIDQYRHHPRVQSLYLHDKMEYEGLVVNAGLRFQRLDPRTSDIDSLLWAYGQNAEERRAKAALSPRLGLSYVVSPSTTFRLGYGRFFQMPLFHQLYQYVDKAGSQQIKGNILGNPALKPPRSTSIEFGTVTELTKELSLDVALYYKEVKDLISIDFVPFIPEGFYQYSNIEQANSSGLELSLRKHFGRHLTGSARYSLSKAVGTGSNTTQALKNALAEAVGETLAVIERQEIPLDFDQRNKFILEVSLFNLEDEKARTREKRLWDDARLSLFFQYGSGLPYTPMVANKLGQETPSPNSARYPATKQVDMKASKYFKLGPLKTGLVFEVLNLFNWDNGNSNYSQEIGPYDIYANDWRPLRPRLDYPSDSPYYEKEGDGDGDGVFSIEEQWERWAYYQELYDNDPSRTGQPRLFRAGLAIKW